MKIAQLLSREEVRRLLGISRAHLAREIRAGRLPVVEIGRRTMVTRDDLAEYIATDLETRLQTLNDVLEAESPSRAFHPGKAYLDTFRAYVSGVQAWARAKDLTDAGRICEEARREVLAEFQDALDEMPPEQAVRVRLRLIEAAA